MKGTGKWGGPHLPGTWSCPGDVCAAGYPGHVAVTHSLKDILQLQKAIWGHWLTAVPQLGKHACFLLYQWVLALKRDFSLKLGLSLGLWPLGR